ncbi:hypothetical protein ABID20_003740 [Rhizobium alvei]
MSAATSFKRTNVPKLKKRADMKLSKFRDYVESLGGTLKIVADMAGNKVDRSSIAQRSRHGSKISADHRQGRGEIEPGRFSEIHPETVTPALITAGHFGAGVAELFLDIALIDLRRRGKAGAQWVTGKLQPPLDLRKIAPYARGQRRLLNKASHFLVVEPFRPDNLALAIVANLIQV